MRHAVSAVALVATLAAAGLAAAQPADPPDDQAGDDDAADTGDDADATPPDVKDAGAAPTPAPTAETESVDALRRRYFELRDKLFRSRARAAAVASALYSTRVEIGLDYKTPRHQTVTRATIRLDGANVYDDTQGQIAQDEAVRFEGYVAPGRHRVTIRVEATAKDDDRFTTASETTFVVVAPRGKDLIVKARAKDDGNMGYRWQRESSGNFRLRLDIDVEAKKSAGGKKGGLIKRSSRSPLHIPRTTSEALEAAGGFVLLAGGKTPPSSSSLPAIPRFSAGGTIYAQHAPGRRKRRVRRASR